MARGTRPKQNNALQHKPDQISGVDFSLVPRLRVELHNTLENASHELTMELARTAAVSRHEAHRILTEGESAEDLDADRVARAHEILDTFGTEPANQGRPRGRPAR